MIKRIVCAALALFLIGCGKEKEASAEAKPTESGSAAGTAQPGVVILGPDAPELKEMAIEAHY